MTVLQITDLNEVERFITTPTNIRNLIDFFLTSDSVFIVIRLDTVKTNYNQMLRFSKKRFI